VAFCVVRGRKRNFCVFNGIIYYLGLFKYIATHLESRVFINVFGVNGKNETYDAFFKNKIQKCFHVCLVIFMYV